LLGLALAADCEELAPGLMLVGGGGVPEAGISVNAELIEIDDASILPPVLEVML